MYVKYSASLARFTQIQSTCTESTRITQVTTIKLQYLHPRFYGIWLAMALLYVLSWLPFSTGMRLCQTLGQTIALLMPRRRRVVDTNLRLCFPDMPAERRKQIGHDHFGQVGRMIFETALLHFAAENRVAKRMEFEGLEHLQTALAKGTGVILLGGHFVSMELAIMGLQQKIGTAKPIHPVYLVHQNPLLEFLISRTREKRAGSGIDNNRIKDMVQSLKHGEIVWYAPDQAFLSKSAVEVPFFATTAWSHTSTARIASITGAAVVPFLMAREGKHYRLKLLPALENFPTDDAVGNVRRYHQILESHINNYPDQYLWVHRRFKRPGHLPDPYAGNNRR